MAGPVFGRPGPPGGPQPESERITPCQDDSIAPVGAPYLCTLPHGHPGPHVAELASGYAVTGWTRGTGRRPSGPH